MSDRRRQREEERKLLQLISQGLAEVPEGMEIVQGPDGPSLAPVGLIKDGHANAGRPPMEDRDAVREHSLRVRFSKYDLALLKKRAKEQKTLPEKGRFTQYIRGLLGLDP